MNGGKRRKQIQCRVGHPAHQGYAKGDHQPQHHPQKGAGGILCLGNYAAGRAVVPVQFIRIKSHKNSSFQKENLPLRPLSEVGLIISAFLEKINSFRSMASPGNESETTGKFFLLSEIIYVILFRQSTCRCSSMAECQLPKLNTGVRFPSPAPHKKLAKALIFNTFASFLFFHFLVVISFLSIAAHFSGGGAGGANRPHSPSLTLLPP